MTGSETGLGRVRMAYIHEPREPHTYRDLDPEQGSPANLSFRLIPIQMKEFAFLRVTCAPKYADTLRYLGMPWVWRSDVN